MSGLEILGAAAASLQLAQFVGQAALYIKKYVDAGKDYNNRLGKLDAQFKLFHRNLITISRAADTIGRSKDRLQHQEEIDDIKDLVIECRTTLLKILDCSRKYQNNEEYRPIFKLAVDYWCYEQNGKTLIDEWRKEINERVKSIQLAITACQTKQLFTISDRVGDIHDTLIRSLSGDSGISMGSQRETYQEVLPNEELDDPPPQYTDEKDEWGLKDFEEQNFYFDTSKLSKAFITAIESENYANVKLLLQNGESPLAVNEDKWCALHYAVRVDSKRIMRALLAAKQVQGVIRAIDQSDKNGDTALHFAAYLGKKNMVRELLDKNADANAKNRHQQSPLFKAAEGNKEQIVEILLAHKAIFLPLEPTPGCLVLQRFNELRIAINHGKVQARKIEVRQGKA